MISAAGRFGARQGVPEVPRASSYAGAGCQALLAAFEEELRKQQAKSCERDVDRIKRAGMSDRLTGKEVQKEEAEKFVF